MDGFRRVEMANMKLDAAKADNQSRIRGDSLIIIANLDLYFLLYARISCTCCFDDKAIKSQPAIVVADDAALRRRRRSTIVNTNLISQFERNQHCYKLHTVCACLYVLNVDSLVLVGTCDSKS